MRRLFSHGDWAAERGSRLRPPVCSVIPPAQNLVNLPGWFKGNRSHWIDFRILSSGLKQMEALALEEIQRIWRNATCFVLFGGALDPRVSGT